MFRTIQHPRVQSNIHIQEARHHFKKRSLYFFPILFFPSLMLVSPSKYIGSLLCLLTFEHIGFALNPKMNELEEAWVVISQKYTPGTSSHMRTHKFAPKRHPCVSKCIYVRSADNQFMALKGRCHCPDLCTYNGRTHFDILFSMS